MTIIAISDTHGLHDLCKLPKGDILIHAGDITENGSEEEVKDFLRWFSRQPFAYKVFIGGNHDFYFEENSLRKIKSKLPAGIMYLQNSGVKIEGLKLWGSPVTPYFLGMAFNKRRGADIKKVWTKIPNDLDILITHGPPKDILDKGLGCEDLNNRLKTVKPRLNIFGHVHEQNGQKEVDGITYVNAAMVNNPDPLDMDDYKLIAQPQILVL
jgi:Icc-related predicted phosphoesterase